MVEDLKREILHSFCSPNVFSLLPLWKEWLLFVPMLGLQWPVLKPWKTFLSILDLFSSLIVSSVFRKSGSDWKSFLFHCSSYGFSHSFCLSPCLLFFPLSFWGGSYGLSLVKRQFKSDFISPLLWPDDRRASQRAHLIQEVRLMIQ